MILSLDLFRFEILDSSLLFGTTLFKYCRPTTIMIGSVKSIISYRDDSESYFLIFSSD